MWVWDGLALIRRGSDIYVNEPHVSGGVPILSKTVEGVRYHEHDFLGTTLWSMDTKGNLVKDYQDTTIFGEGSIQKDRSARFTGKLYDEDLQAYVFPYRNYDASTARWRSSDPAGYPDGINNQFYAAIPTYVVDILGLANAQLRGRSVSGSFGMATHTSMYFSLDQSEYNGLSESQKTLFNRSDDGNYNASISGFEERNSLVPFDTYLGIRPNDPSDTINNTSKISDVTPKEGTTTYDFIKSYLDYLGDYVANETKTDYDWFPNNSDETNCNSIQSTLIEKQVRQ